MSLKVYGGLGALLLVGAGVSQADKKMNYTPTEAVVTSAVVDCYVESGNEKLVHKDTEELAYIDCDMAPYAAVMNDFDADDVHYRVKFDFAYNSPVDGSRQTGSHTKRGKTADAYKRGHRFTIHAHKEEPSKNRF